MSSSDQDTFSDSSSYSPGSYSVSPKHSPFHQGPNYAVQIDGGPRLEIIEQPQDYFRFRYKSEMAGTHGCLLGRGHTGFKTTKTYPMVQLQGFNGRAVIKCTLAQVNNNNAHPHLLEDDESQDVIRDACVDNQYIAKFQGMGIIHIAKKEVPSLLYQKYSKLYAGKELNSKELRSKCESEAKDINLNIVRLAFSAYDEKSGELLCPPVFSEPIYNMKSAATNDLKICRMSKVAGRAKGKEDVYIFVEKVNKKNIEVRFVERTQFGEIVWTSNGIFSQNDVHHQYGIVFKTPPYKDPSTQTDVKVHVELHRPSDGRTSDPIEFTYKADHNQMNKKRKKYSYSSLGSSSGGSIKSISELPVSVVTTDKNIVDYEESPDFNMSPKMDYISLQKPCVEEPLAEALYTNAVDPNMVTRNPLISQANVAVAPMWPVPIQIDSAEFDKMLELGPKLESAEMRDLFCEYADDIKSNSIPLHLETNSISMELFKSSMKLVPDSGQRKTSIQKKDDSDGEKLFNNGDALQIKKLMLEICDMMQNNKYKIVDIKDKLRQIFDIRTKNGDTFLISFFKPRLLRVFEFVTNLLHQVRMSELLNLTNKDSESVLHFVIKKDLPEHIDYLLSKGCDPMVENTEGNNSIHYCVLYQSGLSILLSAIKKYNVKYDIDAYNNDKQTPLHIAVDIGSEASCRLLLRAGANTKARDSSGRTPLHLAAYGNHLDVVRVLLEHIPKNEVDLTDTPGYTALQIVCDIPQHSNSYEIAKLLLQNGATPIKASNNESAWQIVSEKSLKTPSLGNLKDLLQEYVPKKYEVEVEVIKLEPDDEYESAEDWESDSDLRGTVLYIDELSELLDRSGRWRELARRLKCDTLLNWFENSPSPTKTLFSQIKEMDEGYTSRSVAITLNDMGEKKAADVIWRYINKQ